MTIPHPRSDVANSLATSTSIDTTHEALYEAMRIESRRFEMKPRERLIFDEVNAQSTRFGMARVHVEAGYGDLAAVIGLQANHVCAAVKRLELNGVLLCGDGLGIEFNVARWTLTQRVEREVHWRRVNRLRACQGLPAWLLAPEPDLSAGVAECSREIFASIFCGAREVLKAREDGASPDLSGVSPDLGVKNREVSPDLSGVSPDLGVGLYNTHGRGRVRLNVEHELEHRTVQQLNCSKDDSSRLLDLLRTEFVRVHGKQTANEEMKRSGAHWRKVARAWPQMLEEEIAALRDHISTGRKVEKTAWRFIRYYMLQRLGCLNWPDAFEQFESKQAGTKHEKSTKESLSHP